MVSHRLVYFCFAMICFVNALSTVGPPSLSSTCWLFAYHICVDNQAEISHLLTIILFPYIC